jgi:beta-glucosidase
MKKTTQTKMSKVGKGVLACSVCFSIALSGSILNDFSSASAGSSQNAYYCDFNSYAEEQAAANDFNIDIARESFILMKNENEALPLSLRNEKRVSVFGTRSDDIILGGSGSGGGSVQGSVTVKESLEGAGFQINPRLVSLYAGITDTLEPSTSIFKAQEDSFSLYDGAAVIVISRTGSEFNEAKLWGVDGHEDMMDHYYSLDDNEKELIKYTKARFEKVIVIVNSAHPIELGALNEEKTTSNLGVDAILWMGHPGKTGAMALGEVLNGTVNPSGHTSDVYPVDFSKDPTWANFKGNVQSQLVSGYMLKQTNGVWEYDLDANENKQQQLYIDKFYTPEQLNTPNFSQVNVVALSDSSFTSPDYLKYAQVTDMTGKIVAVNGPNNGAQYYATLDYEEGIYVGYRWYETAYAEIKAGNYVPDGYDSIVNLTERADKWYSDNVVYPFGYGLSYTEFNWTIENSDDFSTAIDTSDGATITLNLKVTNNGSIAGKDVAEIYFHAPYTSGGIEKSEVTLIEYAKSDVIAPGKSQNLTVTFKVQDMASYDYSDANTNGFAGYELEAGSYTIGVYDDSHIAQTTVDFTVDTGVQYTTDSTTGATITNLFTGDGTWDGTRSDSEYYSSIRDSFISPESQMTILSRGDFKGTYPEAPTAADLKWSDDAIKIMNSQVYYSSFNDKSTDPWYVTAADMTGKTQATETEATDRVNGKTSIQLADMTGLDYGSAEWENFMNQLTYKEMTGLISSDRFSTPALAAIGKSAEKDADGPAQFSSGTFWCSEVNIASTWNDDLAYKQGQFVGNESLLLNVQGWYGPGLNFHRSPAAGRNFEYYSQDGLHGGKIAASVIKGATDKGTIVYMKHLFGNDQETSRYTASTFITEQAIREIYIKPFELAIKEGNATASMSGFNKIGLVANTANYNLYVKLLQNEFGFKYSSVTDMFGWSYCPGSSGDMAARISITPLGSWDNTFGRNIEGVWDDEAGCVKVTFTDKITSGTRWTVNETTGAYVSGGAMNASNPGSMNTVNGGASASYKSEGVLYAEGDTMLSYTQWNAVRTAAMRLLYASANSNAMKNNIDQSAFVDNDTFTGTQGTALKNMSVAATATNAVSTEYNLVSGSLPEGVQINLMGAVSGTPKTAGTYTFSVSQTVDGWITKTQNYTLTVASAFTLSTQTATVGSEYNGSVSSQTIKPSSGGWSTVTVDYTLANGSSMPEGLTLAADGSITGTPTKAGSYTIDLVVDQATISSWSGTSHNYYNTSITLIVADSGTAPVEGKTIISIEETKVEGLVHTYTITYSDNTTYAFTVTDGAKGETGTTGPQGEKGETGLTGPQGEKGEIGLTGVSESGCGSVMGGEAIMMAGLALISVLALRHKKKVK